MEKNEIYCPNCGSPQQVINGRNDFFCMNCGFHISLNINVDVKNIKSENVQIIRDEARIKEAEVELKRLEYEREKDRLNNKRMLYDNGFGLDDTTDPYSYTKRKEMQKRIEREKKEVARKERELQVLKEKREARKKSLITSIVLLIFFGPIFHVIGVILLIYIIINGIRFIYDYVDS